MEFKDFQLETRLINGLSESGYITPTKIQTQVIPFALENKSIIASSKTGSGKTLAFLIPMLNKLQKLKWKREDGLGALVITPTRELAVQIFETLNKIGQYINLSVGTVIGGIEKKKIMKGMEVVPQLSIIIATPGRLLHYFQESYFFTAHNLQFLVLDEADKMIEMGFKEDIEQILEFLSKDRQTLLFSATPNSIAKKIKCLEMNDYEIVGEECVSENVPKKLKQIYFKIDGIDKKINFLYECVVNNIKRKAIVFFSTCKEVKFFYLLFSKIFNRRNGRDLFYMLNGNMKQERRIELFKNFQDSKSGILFCTDLGSRGLDFQDVNLVVQYDCPESIETYFHRIGRTARNEKDGTSILYLIKEEIKIIKDIGTGKSFKNGIKNNNEDKFMNLISEKKHKPKKDIQSLVKRIINENIEIENFAYKYLKSYKKFLELNNKRYFKNTIDEIIKIKKWLGLKDEF